MSERLQIDDHGRVRVLTLDRPEVLNTFDDEQYDLVRVALDEAAHDPDVAVVVLTGLGRAFSAGQDLSELGRPPRHSDGQPHGFGPFIHAVSTFPKPLVAAVNGLAVGIGLTLLPHCDLVLIAEDARLRAPFTRLGVTVEAANSHLLPALVGWQNAAHLLFTSEWIEAEDAVRIGLAWKRLPIEDLLPETVEIATTIARMPIDSLVATKQLLLAARREATKGALEREPAVFARLARGPALRQALAAFRDGQDPDFTALPMTFEPDLELWTSRPDA